jgi:hypothetical protein
MLKNIASNYRTNRKLQIITLLSVAGILVLVAVIGSRNSGSSGAAPKSSSGIAVNTMGFTPSSGKIPPGTTFSVSLIENSGTEGVNAVQAKILYDAAKLTFVSIDEPGVFEQIAATDTATPGEIQVARATTGTPLTGTNPIVRINFMARTEVSGIATIQLETGSSYIVRASDATNILTGVVNASFGIRGR